MLKSLIETPIAHRGLHDQNARPENSLAAFAAAADLGYPIELDVRPLADATPVAFHDRGLSRLTGEEGLIEQIGRRGLGEFRLCGTDEVIPLFSDVLDLVRGRVPLLVEVKKSGAAGNLEENLRDHLLAYTGEFAVQSFNEDTIAWFRANEPSFERGLICDDYSTLEPAAVLRCAPRFIACGLHGLPSERQELPLLTWTVRSEAESDAALLVADNIIFENFRPKRPMQSPRHQQPASGVTPAPHSV